MSHVTGPRVLVTGGSIAGPALAWALHREGFAPVVVERSAQLRSAGQNIDVRGLGDEVVRRMGIRDAVLVERTGELGTRFVDDTGHSYAEMATQESGDGPTAELEILRGRLSRILVDHIEDDVEIRYGDFVTALEQDLDGVDVTFDSGRRERFDLVLVAEGRTSRTRRLVFADRSRTLDKGLNIAFGTLDRQPADTDWWEFMTTTNGRSATIRPDNLGTMRTMLAFSTPVIGFETLPFDAQLHILRERFHDAGWQVERILDGFAAHPEEFYSDRWAQVVVSQWSTGRVALVGDAAWGSGPTGMATTLALVGTHVLAGELGAALRAGRRPQEAFNRYETLLRRYVDTAQGLAPGMPRLAYPDSATGVAAVRLLHRAVANPTLGQIAQKAFRNSQNAEPVLPQYPRLRAERVVAAS
jgi:2-polyprenyl-6-methoxyphenol hydroxylase-like FAD-dependent oxidoreductase